MVKKVRKKFLWYYSNTIDLEAKTRDQKNKKDIVLDLEKMVNWSLLVKDDGSMVSLLSCL